MAAAPLVVTFARRRTAFDKAAVAALNQVAEALTLFPLCDALLMAAVPRGEPSGPALAARRLSAVKRFLVKAGVPAKRVLTATTLSRSSVPTVTAELVEGAASERLLDR